jgi:hypothetical protein
VDRVLAKQGYSGQMTAEPETPGRPDNLMAALPGDHGTHGRFDARARNQVGAVDPMVLRGALGLGLGLLAWAAWPARHRQRYLPR